MKNILKTLVALLAISIVTYSCDNKNENDPQDPVKDKVENPTNSTNPTDQENENLPITSQNLQGDWVLVGWEDSEYPNEDLSYAYGRRIGIYEGGILDMQKELWEGLFGYFDTWFYSSTNNLLIFSDSTLEYETMSFSVNSLAENKLEIIYETHTLTFEKQ